MLLFDLTHDRVAFEGHISIPEQGNIRMELQLDKAISEAVSCLLHREYENSFRIEQMQNISIDIY